MRGPQQSRGSLFLGLASPWSSRPGEPLVSVGEAGTEAELPGEEQALARLSRHPPCSGEARRPTQSRLLQGDGDHVKGL